MQHVKDILNHSNELNWKVLFYLILERIDVEALVLNTTEYYVDRVEYTLSPIKRKYIGDSPEIYSTVEISVYHRTTRQITIEHYNFNIKWVDQLNEIHINFTYDNHFRWHTFKHDEIMPGFEKKKLLMS